MGFHPDSQAIEATLGCVQCSTILCTGKVGQSSLVHQCLDVFEGSFSCCQLEYMLLQAKQGQCIITVLYIFSLFRLPTRHVGAQLSLLNVIQVGLSQKAAPGAMARCTLTSKTT